MKNKFLFVLAMLSVLTISGCKDKNDNTNTVLQAPQEVMVQSDGEKSLIIFDEVKNAEYYDIYINDVCVTVKSSGTGTIQFDASKIITLPQKYTIKVKAGGDKYFDSAFTSDYEYNHTSVLDTPVVSIDGTTLNWNKIANAEFYDVVVNTFNPSSETIHRFATNKFDFSNMLANKGEYLFKVCAISESGEYISSPYSNQVKYTHVLTLTTPHNLQVAYSAEVGEYLLSFVSSENVDGFTININGINYSLPQSEMSSFLHPNDLDNVYILKLETFIKSKGLKLDSSTLTTISVKANTSNAYLISSEFSSKLSFNYISVLVAPKLDIFTTEEMCTINITSNNEGSKYLSGFAIYLNDRKYKTLSSDITQIEFPLTDEIRKATIRVQAISNNSNCHSSNLSNGCQIGVKPVVSVSEIAYNNGIISWVGNNNPASYYVEILNSSYRYAQIVTEQFIDISNICPCGEYYARITPILDGHAQLSEVYDIIHTTKLKTPENINITSSVNGTYLHFDKVDGAYGYLLYLNGNEEPIMHLFESAPINLAPYISESNQYSVQVQAVGIVNKGIESSDISETQLIQSVKTLTAPTLTISKEDNKYYLNVYIEQTETEIVDGYEIWVNYQSIGNNFKSGKIDITSYFTNAGQYNFMAKALAIDNPYIKDSNMATLTYNCIKQLDTVTDIKVTKLESESKYILTFKEQTLAAKYRVTIVKDDDYSVEFELNHGVADISTHLVENGIYRVYVQALATEGSFYTDSATSGNPFRLVKGETLATPQNISITKNANNGSVSLNWGSVENSSGYQVYVYYDNLGQNVLKKSIFVPHSLTPSVDIGYGQYLCLDKEGHYTIQIKALGDDKLYENSQTATTPYIYTMETSKDFSRNTVFINGNTYNYNIENSEQLKNLLWYHYLYNQNIWEYDILQYNLKVYCSTDLNVLAQNLPEYVKTQINEIDIKLDNGLIDAKTANEAKMNIISKALLAQYPEIIKYTEGSRTQSFCLNPETNTYIFRYQNDLDNVKTETITTENQVYKEKLEAVDVFEQRNSTYVFAIDNQQSVDVSTTEQLFMALQYNKKPNFVGDYAVAKTVYENARFILRQICSDDMSDYDKVLQIYDLLTKQITWNNVATGSFDEVIASTQTVRGNLKDLYLEGILYNFDSANGLYTSLDQVVGHTADSQGLSKVFVALCAIEGIDAIKVNGQKTINNGQSDIEVDYSWNKVYIDIENDGIDGKRWLVVDTTSAIQNTIDIRRSGVTTTYQVTLHKYFLMTDAEFKNATGLQATNLHKRLGDTTDYVASDYVENHADVDYYTLTKYSCVYKSHELVKDATLTASQDSDIVNAMIYATLKANKTHRIVIDVDANEYIALKGDSDSTISHINTLYATANDRLMSEFSSNITITIVEGRYIVMAIQGENYAG